MTRPTRHRARAWGLTLAASFAMTANAYADSIASSASSAGSASVGSVSDSFRGSSNSSQRDNRLADGDYRIDEIAAAPDRPGMLRLKLAPAAETAGAAGAAVWLDLPQATGERSALRDGDIVHARNRAYGLELARADTREPFFLVLADDSFEGLAPKPVGL